MCSTSMCSTSILGLKPSKPIIYTNNKIPNGHTIECGLLVVIIRCGCVFPWLCGYLGLGHDGQLEKKKKE